MERERDRDWERHEEEEVEENPVSVGWRERLYQTSWWELYCKHAD